MTAEDVKNALPSLFVMAAAIYPDEYVSDGFELGLNRAVYNFMHDANRNDVPIDAMAPLIEWVSRKLLWDAYEAETIVPDWEKISTEKGIKAVSIKSTRVDYGDSETDKVKTTRKEILLQLKKELDLDWNNLICAHRKLRW